jgi:hypothetical protein
LEQVTRQAIEALDADATLVKVTDYAKIMQYPIMSTPALVVNEKVVVAGRVPSQAEVTTWLTNALAQQPA